MSSRLRFLGAAGYEIAGSRGRILIDPFLAGNPAAPCGADDLATPDVILVTHGAPDHLGDTAAIAARTGAPVICGADVRALLLDGGLPASQVRATIWGIVVEVAGLVIRPVESHHWSAVTLASGAIVTGTPLGFIVEPEAGTRIYHLGDTAIFGDLRLIGELYRPTVAIIGPLTPRRSPSSRAPAGCSRASSSRPRPRSASGCSAPASRWQATTWTPTIRRSPRSQQIWRPPSTAPPVSWWHLGRVRRSSSTATARGSIRRSGKVVGARRHWRRESAEQYERFVAIVDRTVAEPGRNVERNAGLELPAAAVRLEAATTANHIDELVLNLMYVGARARPGRKRC